jgi:predicted nucleic acid-binding protein
MSSACLVDTNVLVRLAVPADPRHLSARRAVEALQEEGLFVASQNFVELWNVATRPVENNGLGQTTTVADQILRSFEQAFPRLPESEKVYDRWRELENVAHLEEVPPTGAWVIALPMKIAGGSGGPVRIVALVPEG